MKSFQFPTTGKRPSASSSSLATATTPSPSNPHPPSKKELEEQRKRLEEQAAAEAFEEYVAVFQDGGGGGGGGGKGGGSASKVWVKAGTYDAGRRQEDIKDKGKLYKPTSRFEKDGGGGGGASVPSIISSETERPDKPGSKKKQTEKKKSNLEIFKEELKIIQEEREERHRLKKMLGLQEVIKLPPKPGDDLRASLSLELDDIRMMGGSGGGGGSLVGGGGSIDDGDPNTTNIYLGNLPTKISEQQLMEVFGRYGPLASVKVMWPRTEEEKARNRLSGFVAFMSRRDGERALKNLTGKEILGSEIKLGWGKAVPIPAYPVYIPPQMLELTMPPPLSGLPFNAQVEHVPGQRSRDRGSKFSGTPPYPTATSDPKDKEEFERVLYNATVKVVMPTDRALLSLVHRMVEFVLREGPMFEAMIMNKEISNPQFRFLFENQSPAHVYYRWKLFSILQGDSTQRWRTEEFRMFKGGSVWRPPKLNPFTQGMPDDLIPEEEREDIRIGSLSNAQRTRLERMLRKITPDRHKVAEVMIFSIEHSESTEEICTCIKESLCNPTTSLQKKIARLYVLNDVLHNCTVKGMNAFGYRKAFKSLLPTIFQELHYSYEQTGTAGNNVGSGSNRKETGSNTIGESFKQRVMGCFKAWDEWGVYSSEYLIRLQNIFLGLASVRDEITGRTSPSSYNNDPQLESTTDPNNKSGRRNPKTQSDNNDDDDGDGSSDEEKARASLNVHRQKLHKKAAPPRAQLPPQSAMKLVKALQSRVGGGSGDEDGPPEISEELDGVPLEEEEEVVGGGAKAVAPSSKFIPSKWEELDPEQVKAGAVTTTSKWDLFEEQQKLAVVKDDDEGMDVDDEDETDSKMRGRGRIDLENEGMGDNNNSRNRKSKQQRESGLLVGYGDEDDEDIDGVPMEDDDDMGSYPAGGNNKSDNKTISLEEEEELKRAKLREVEMKVLAFQDELERRGVIGDASGSGGLDLVREYREKLLRKINERVGDMGSSTSQHHSYSKQQHDSHHDRSRSSGRRDRDRRKKSTRSGRSRSSEDDYDDEEKRGGGGRRRRKRRDDKGEKYDGDEYYYNSDSGGEDHLDGGDADGNNYNTDDRNRKRKSRRGSSSPSLSPPSPKRTSSTGATTVTTPSSSSGNHRHHSSHHHNNRRRSSRSRSPQGRSSRSGAIKNKEDDDDRMRRRREGENAGGGGGSSSRSRSRDRRR